MNSLLLLAAFVVVSAAVAGCASQPANPPAAIPTTIPLPVATVQQIGQISPFYGDWVVTTMGNAGGTLPVTPSVEISLTINSDQTLQGYDGCNNYQAPYTLTGISSAYGNGITIGTVVSTQQYCRGLADQENAFLQTLQTTTAFAGDATHLTFTDINGDVLVFHRPGAVPTATALPQYP